MKFYSLILFIFPLILLSCNQQEKEVIEDLKTNALVNVIPYYFEDGESRVDLTVREGIGVFFGWNDHDTLGIFPQAGLQIPFPISSKNAADASYAKFNGGDWCLKKNSYYAAYYPYTRRAFLEETPGVVPVSYVGQKQIANNSTSLLGNFDFLATDFEKALPEVMEDGVVVDGGYIHFIMHHLGTIMRLEFKAPIAAHLKKITLTSTAEEFGNEVKFNLNSWNTCSSCTNYLRDNGYLASTEECKHPTTSIVTASNNFEMELGNFAVDANEQVFIYLMMYQTPNHGSQMQYKVETDSGNFVGTVTTNKEYRPGLLYRLVSSTTNVQP